MSAVKYLIAGSSHAGLSAVQAIRMQDEEGAVTMLTQEDCAPYSPTILPYVVSGEAGMEAIFLRDESDFARMGVTFRPKERLIGLDTASQTVTLASGEILGYENLLLATGAASAKPRIPGLEETTYYTLRTLDEAVKLRRAMEGARSAVVLGAGLVGMHAAENLAKKGLQVTVVEALGQVLPGYFDEGVAALIEKVFRDQGVEFLTGREVKHISKGGEQVSVGLASGQECACDLLLVSTGVAPRMDYALGSDVETDQGILVDQRMRTSAAGVWAAGDVAQAPGFFGPESVMNPTLLNATDQGRVAGRDMAQDDTLKPYAGCIPMNVYRFFGHRAMAIGKSTFTPEDRGGADEEISRTEPGYRNFLFQEDRLVGVASVDSDLDPGIMAEIIRQRIDLGSAKTRLTTDQLGTGRMLMAAIWL
jgi:phenylglyoxylate dehydrogenase epsilon subunit